MHSSLVHMSPQSGCLVCSPMRYTPMVYIDSKVQLPLPKQDMTKHPKSYKTDQIGIKSAFLSN